MNISEIAVVGIGTRLPGANSSAELWDLVRSGRTTYAHVDPETSQRWGFSEEQIADPAFIPVTSSLSEPDGMDADYFGIPPHEAALMDPQHRVFLEVVWAALEDSGHAGDYGNLRVGLFGSVSASSYLSGPLTAAGLWDPADPNYGVMLANDKDFICTRTAYTLGFTGPAVVAQSACSSSLVAVHLARCALLNDECDVAIVAGSSISIPHLGGYLQRKGGIFSPSGACRPFDATSDGTIKGNGAVAVVLRPALDAQLDGDRSYAVLSGSAINNDGRDKAGFPAPGVNGQAAVLKSALEDSGVDANDVRYIETHGTGTQLGDPLEIRALGHAYPRLSEEPTWLGSLKANMGHLDTAAGVAGLAKAALVLHHQTVPPMAGFREPNPLLGLPATRFAIPTAPITPTDRIPAAAVSSFGMGGTNAHVVLRAADVATEIAEQPWSGPVIVSVHGPRPEVARSLRDQIVEIARSDDCDVRDIAFSLDAGRRSDRFRIRAEGDNPQEALNRLTTAQVEDLGERGWSSSTWTPECGVIPAGRRRIPLPLTPLQRQRHWCAVAGTPQRHVAAAPVSVIADVPTTQPKADVAEPPHATAGTPPQVSLGEVTDKILLTMRDLLVLPDLRAHDDFFDNGADSLLAIDLLGRVEETYAISLQFAVLEHERSAADLARHILTLLEPSAAEIVVEPALTRSLAQSAPEDIAGSGHGNLVRISGHGARNLFLVHPAGGTTACYVDLARHITADVVVHGLYYPSGLARDERTMRALAVSYLAAIRSKQPHGPYLVGGYSFGGNLAAEMALQLEEMGEEVERLILIDSHPPHAYTFGDCSEHDYVAAFPHLLKALFPDAQVNLEEVSQAGTIEQILASTDLPGWSQATKLAMGDFFTVWCDNHSALKRWTPDRNPTCPVTVIEASEPEPAEVLQRLSIQETSVREWTRYLDGSVDFVPVDGDHYSIFRDQQALASMGTALTTAMS